MYPLACRFDAAAVIALRRSLIRRSWPRSPEAANRMASTRAASAARSGWRTRSRTLIVTSASSFAAAARSPRHDPRGPRRSRSSCRITPTTRIASRRWSRTSGATRPSSEASTGTRPRRPPSTSPRRLRWCSCADSGRRGAKERRRTPRDGMDGVGPADRRLSRRRRRRVGLPDPERQGGHARGRRRRGSPGSRGGSP